ncbi:UNVERIFIED_CONTAM: MscS family membrane protein [Acetivibrio alkalicellulosi]
MITLETQFIGDIKTIGTFAIFNTDLRRLFFASIVVLLSLIVRQVFRKFILKVLSRTTSFGSKENFIEYIVKVIEAPARFLIVVLGIWCAITIIDFPPESINLLNRIFRSLVVFTVFRVAYRATDVLAVFIQKISCRSEIKFDDMLMAFVKKCIRVLIIVLSVITIIQEWYDNVGGLLAGLGLGGLAFALAARDTVSNLFGSVTIMIDRPFKIGDWITTSNADGVVEEIGFRSTRIRGFSQAVMTIPNSVMSNESITNWSKMGKRRISFHLGLKYSSKAEEIQEFVSYFREMLRKHPEIHPETIIVSFEDFGESSLRVFFYFFTKATSWQKYLEVREDVNFHIMAKLQEVGLEVAFPSTTVYLANNIDEKII